jgi:hypothetical protein
MGSVTLRALEARLTRLEARVATFSDPVEEKERERILLLYLDLWDREGGLEDVSEKDRDPIMWKAVSDYAPVYLEMVCLEMVWEGLLDGREEALADGVDFTRLEGVDEDDVAAVRAGGTPGAGDQPRVAPKRRGNRSLPKEDG